MGKTALQQRTWRAKKKAIKMGVFLQKQKQQQGGSSSDSQYRSEKEKDIDSRNFEVIDLTEARRLSRLQNTDTDHSGFIATGNSFHINESLRRAFWDDPNGDELRNLSDRNKQVVQKLDKAMRPLGKDVLLTRFVDWNGGWKQDGFVDSLNRIGFDGTEKSIKGVVSEFTTFTSTSWNRNINVFGHRDTELIIKAPKETKTLIDDDFTRESEIILARHTKFRIDSFKNTGRRKRLEITLLPD